MARLLKLPFLTLSAVTSILNSILMDVMMESREPLSRLLRGGGWPDLNRDCLGEATSGALAPGNSKHGTSSAGGDIRSYCTAITLA